MDKESSAIRFLKLWVYRGGFSIITITVKSMSGLIGFQGIREEVFVMFFLVFVKLWNKTVLLCLCCCDSLHAFACFCEDGLLTLDWSFGTVWWSLGASWLNGLTGFGVWLRELQVNKVCWITGVAQYWNIHKCILWLGECMLIRWKEWESLVQFWVSWKIEEPKGSRYIGFDMKLESLVVINHWL